jgi:hypothetical protein
MEKVEKGRLLVARREDVNFSVSAPESVDEE